MEPERRYTQKVKKAFHISMASMDISTSGDEPSQIMCGYDGRNYLLCTLRKPDMIQCALDLEFAEGTEVSFASNGKSHIHLTGYLTDMDDADGLNLEDLEEEQEDEEVQEEETVEVPQKSSKKKKKGLENGPPAKKAKVNGIKEAESEDEDDSDEAEEEGEDEEDSDEEGDEEDGGEEEEEDSDSDEEVEEEQPKVVKSKKQKKQQEANKAKQPPLVNGEKKKEQKKPEQQKAALQRKKLDHGVIIQDLKVGEGPEAKSSKFVTVYYEGRLEKTGKVFDQSNKGPGFKFRLGKQEVIKGWDVGVAGMKVGGKRKIVCPPNAAYGARGSPPVIPPNSTLVFTVELKKVQ